MVMMLMALCIVFHCGQLIHSWYCLTCVTVDTYAMVL